MYCSFSKIAYRTTVSCLGHQSEWLFRGFAVLYFLQDIEVNGCFLFITVQRMPNPVQDSAETACSYSRQRRCWLFLAQDSAEIGCNLFRTAQRMPIRVGRFCPFLEFHQKSWVCGSPRYNIGNYQFFFILVQKPVRATP